MTISKHAYTFNSVYRTIANRLRNRHNINIGDHIDTMLEIGARAGQGITFRPIDSNKLKSLLKMPAFAHDDRRNLCERIAAAATKGEGYREVGAPSLHCQIAANSCNIHLDSYGFVAIAPDGTKYYNPDLVQHIVDELGWATVVGWLDKKQPVLGGLVGRFRPILPNSRNRYAPAVGGRFVLAKGKGWGLGIDHTVSTSGERQTKANLEVLNW
ncbi:MAG: hypothetical protein AB2728_04435 [Candidatus Thiodiazotropha sp.]|nr:hypothetical protein [Candidatus Thiodiazotropha sp. (ex Lucina pensylvanica)]MBT3065002.1 hypothetical protein [Candidatus Thiodiazotropha sp. (ex Lucina pensylvanica)]PUB72473.1 MAG: hypothetical protein DBP03_16980 [gamma proteobacterium symbiont of Ctena orbiculata]PUB79898.1 MAG: hypothetical protein DBO99_02670 [gamma proteobacterium symbiont of Ctena orbiculata]